MPAAPADDIDCFGEEVQTFKVLLGQNKIEYGYKQPKCGREKKGRGRREEEGKSKREEGGLQTGHLECRDAVM